MKPYKIVITGGPGTGKTAIIDFLAKAGFYCFPEVIRSMTLQAKENGTITSVVSNPIASVDDPMAFNIKILEGRIMQYKEALALDVSPIFFDRGVPDVLAYMNYFKQEYTEKFTMACKNHRYTKIFVLPPWKDIYIADNERFETFEEAKAIHLQLQEVYAKVGYEPITVPTGTIEARAHFILNQIENL